VLNAREVVQADLQYICRLCSAEFEQMSGKGLLITGGAGFLGYYLVQAALYWNKQRNSSEAIRVTVYDNYIRGIPAWLKHLDSDANLSVVNHDVTDPLPAAAGEFEYIIHAAGIASPTYYRKYPIETMDANTNGLRHLLEYARAAQHQTSPVAGFLFYSSSEIYGDPAPDHIPTPENYRGNVSCTGPRACYDESKRYGETLCVNFAHQYKLPIKIARPFNNYGPGLKITDRRVIPDFARDIVSENDIAMLSDGLPKRTFCYVTDAIIGYYKVLTLGRSGEAYNIGIEKPEVSVAEIAERMIRHAKDLFGYKGRLVRKASPEREYLTDNPNRRCPDITKARTELGYNPTIDIDEGLRRSLVWYYDNRDAAEA
jgi:UDP-glucuronate decarboxylase